jgi:hypothetical protein
MSRVVAEHYEEGPVPTGLSMTTRSEASIPRSEGDPGKTDNLTPLSEADAEVLHAIRNIRYGSVEVTIHDSRVVQIERKEKRRFGHTNGR